MKSLTLTTSLITFVTCMGRPRKNFEDTYKGRREAKRLAKEARLEEKAEKKSLYERGLCKLKEGRIVSFKEAGALAWEEASTQEKVQRKEIGRREGKRSWEEADFYTREEIRAENREAAKQA